MMENSGLQDDLLDRLTKVGPRVKSARVGRTTGRTGAVAPTASGAT